MKKNYFSIPSKTILTNILSFEKYTKPFSDAGLNNHLYFGSNRRKKNRLKKIFLFLILSFLGLSFNLFSQENDKGFNEQYYKGLAFKKQLNPAETKEFLDFQRIHYLYPDSFTVKSASISNHSNGKLIGGGGQTQTVVTGCNNIDFEAGSATGWTLTSGFHPNSSNTPTCCPTSGAQNLIVNSGVDPYGGFPRVFPGGSFSLRLGDNNTGAQADRLQQKIFVTPANANFTYRYAVVLQDPGHTLTQQPSFIIEMVDTLGNQVPCTFYNVAAGSNIPGFFTSTVNTGVIYKPWTSVAVDLTPNIGQNIFIRFTTYDCSLGGHFGYAYIDGFCTNFETAIADTTCPGVPINICGPIGFGFYSWNGPGITTNTNQCVNVTTPGVYTCQTILGPGCPGPTFTHTLNTWFKPVLSFTPSTTNACTMQYSFASTSSIATGSVVSYFWDFGNGNTSTIPNPLNTYTAPGTYAVKFKATSNRACSDSVIQSITIYPYPVISFNPPNSCLNSVVNFSSTSTIAVGSVNTFTWNFGNGIVSTATNPINTYTAIGAYNVTLTAASDQSCISTAISALTIHPLPMLGFTSSSLCFGNNTVFNPTISISAGSISTFTWNLGNGVSANTFSAGTNYTSSGNYVISLSASSNQQCSSSQTQTITIHPLPVVSFTANGTCLNTPSTFSSAISIPLGSITSFSWNFGNGNTSGAIPNPSITYSSAIVYTPSLTAISNMSCTNMATNTAVVYPLPNVAFIATTQCINSAVNFTNTSSISSGTLISYLWNFGLAQTSTSINPIYTFTNSGNFPVTLTAQSDQSCTSTNTNNIIVQPQPTVVAVSNSTLCSNINTIALSSTVTGISNSGQWSSSGTGVFSNSIALNTNYSITTVDKISGLVIFTLTSTNNSACAAASNTTALIITPIATVNAGPNLNVCSSQNTFGLSGSVTSPSATGVWSGNGSGVYALANTSLSNSYSMTSVDINNALVTFSLSSTNNGTCPIVIDTVMMRISKQPTVTTIPNFTLCSNANTVALSGTVIGVTNSGLWVNSGSGAFNNNTLSTCIYSISNNDKNSGSVNFTLNSTNNGVCPAASSSLLLSFAPIATVLAGPNLTICSTNIASLTANIIGSTNTGTWSTGGNGTFSSANSFNSLYTPGINDLFFGAVNLFLTSTNNGFCPPVRDTVLVTINKQATVSVLPSFSVCSIANTVALTGTVAGAANTGSWSSNGSGTFNNQNQPNCVYTISSTDKATGSVIFTLSSSGNGACSIANQTTNVSVVPISTVNAGTNQLLCSSVQSVALSGTVLNVPNGQWTSNGGGTFINANSLNASYFFSANDVNNGSAHFTLTSTGNSVCPSVVDTLQIKILRQAVVNVGPDLSLCSNSNTINLNGQILGSTNTGTWSTNGNGGFTSSNAPTVTYSIGPGDLNKSAIQFILFSTNNNICNIDSDTLMVQIAIQPTVTLNGDTTICENPNSIQLSGKILSGSGAQQWTSNGSGTFTPNSFSNPSKYTLSLLDIKQGFVFITLNSLNNNACGNIGSTFVLNILPSPKIGFSSSVNQLSLPNNSVSLINQSTGASSYTWSFGNGSSSNATNTTVFYNQVGKYHIVLRGENEKKCIDSSDTYIDVSSEVLWPNAFTPNTSGSNGGKFQEGDFSNDVFFPFVKGVAEFDLMIFNRWGQMIFRSKDINIGWDGYFNGKLCQQDIYVWKANILFIDGRTYVKTGSISLIR